MRTTGSLTVSLFLLILCCHYDSTRGSLVVFNIAQDGSFFVIASDSRTVNSNDTPIGDHACKIISLSSDTLFFAVGTTSVQSPSDELWTAQDAAHSSYAKVPSHAIAEVAEAWEANALVRFSTVPKDALLATRGKDDSLISGGFVRYEKGAPHLRIIRFFYRGGPPIVTAEVNDIPLGKLGVVGVADDIAREYIEGKTQRAIDADARASRTRVTPNTTSVDAEALFVETAVQFTLDNVVDPLEKKQIAGPIDVAVLQLNEPIRWIRQKPECQDEKH